MLKIFIILALLSSCSVAPIIYNHNPLVGQILKVRKEFPNKLTNSACLKYDDKDNCINFDIVAYDLSDASFRKQANDFHFVCQIGDKRYRISKDQPGYVRNLDKCKKTCWFKCCQWEQDIILATNHQYLLNAGTTCQKEEN